MTCRTCGAAPTTTIKIGLTGDCWLCSGAVPAMTRQYVSADVWQDERTIVALATATDGARPVYIDTRLARLVVAGQSIALAPGRILVRTVAL